MNDFFRKIPANNIIFRMFASSAEFSLKSINYRRYVRTILSELRGVPDYRQWSVHFPEIHRISKKSKKNYFQKNLPNLAEKN